MVGLERQFTEVIKMKIKRIKDIMMAQNARHVLEFFFNVSLMMTEDIHFYTEYMLIIHYHLSRIPCICIFAQVTKLE